MNASVGDTDALPQAMEAGAVGKHRMRRWCPSPFHVGGADDDALMKVRTALRR